MSCLHSLLRSPIGATCWLALHVDPLPPTRSGAASGSRRDEQDPALLHRHLGTARRWGAMQALDLPCVPPASAPTSVIVAHSTCPPLPFLHSHPQHTPPSPLPGFDDAAYFYSLPVLLRGEIVSKMSGHTLQSSHLFSGLSSEVGPWVSTGVCGANRLRRTGHGRDTLRSALTHAACLTEGCGMAGAGPMSYLVHEQGPMSCKGDCMSPSPPSVAPSG